MNRKLQMIKEFQCTGCVCGSDPETCDRFALSDDYGFACTSHVLGTSMMSATGVLTFALGLPKGFCRAGHEQGPGGCATANGRRNKIAIRMWTRDTRPRWDNLNVPVWALDRDGFLFVRTFSPRTNMTFVDVVDGGTRAALCPTSIDVAPFMDEID